MPERNLIQPAPIEHHPQLGLRGEYFADVELAELRFARVDPKVDFSWYYSSPSPLLGADHFSVRWTAELVAEHSEEYILSTVSDDGVRLWVADQLIIDNWTDHPGTEDTASIELVEGERYPLRLEFYERTGGATIHLLWESGSQPKEVVPERNLITE